LGIQISNKVRRRSPVIPYERIKDEVLGTSYELSLVFCGRVLSQQLNRIYRDKNQSTNVLSFPLEKDSGEIFIDLEIAREEATRLSMTFVDFVLYLFIHGLLHLNGMSHGATMDKKEKKLFTLWRDKLQLEST
jgi:rRNA maturation RNase YbeY